MRAFAIVFAASACLAFAAPSGNSSLIRCYTKTDCDSNINCPQGQDCTVECIGNRACYQKTITCPDNFNCLVKCDSGTSQTCAEATFVQGNGGTFNLLAFGNEATYQASVKNQCNTPSCKVTCTGQDNSACYDLNCNGSGCPSNPLSTLVGDTNVITCNSQNDCPQQIICKQGANCEVDCNGNGACDQKQIVCPDNYGCLIKCNTGAAGSCSEANFVQGDGTSALSVLCAGDDACDQAVLGNGACNKPTCSVSCSGGNNVCNEFNCVGNACPNNN